MTAISYLDRGKLSVAAGPIATELGLSPIQLGSEQAANGDPTLLAALARKCSSDRSFVSLPAAALHSRARAQPSMQEDAPSLVRSEGSQWPKRDWLRATLPQAAPLIW
jgi:hypothetical protein